MKRIKTPQSLGRDYKQMLKDYFGKFLYGLEVTNEGGRPKAQVIYFDFKHINTVRRELVQMMPEVEFVKLKRDFTNTAQRWALGKLLAMEGYSDSETPVIYVQHGDTLVKSSLYDIALTELNQLELEENDSIPYDDDSDLRCCPKDDEERLRSNSWE